jgi:large subunit ribosomal protein L7/L12
MDEENERFDTVLVRMRWWDKKIDVIKLVREVTGLGLSEARDFIEHLPQTVKEDVSSEEGRALNRRFYDLGADLEMRPSSRT